MNPRLNIMLILWMLFFLHACGSDTPSRLKNDACIHFFESFPKQNADLTDEGMAVAKKEDGSVAFLVQQQWDLKGQNHLVFQKPTNQVRLVFKNAAGQTPQSVKLIGYRLVMDMGERAHTTDECQKVEVVKSQPHEITLKNIFFVMASRQKNKWFFYDLYAEVDGVEAKIPRLDIPYPVL